MIWGIGWFICGLIAMAIGQRKGEGFSGLIAGCILGPLGILLTMIGSGNRMPCPFCKEKIHKDASICPHCREKLQDDTAATTRRLPVTTNGVLGVIGTLLILALVVVAIAAGSGSVSTSKTEDNGTGSVEQEQKDGSHKSLDFSRPIYTTDYAVICPASLFSSNQADMPQKIYGVFISIFGHDEKVKELGCEEWRQGIRVYAHQMDGSFHDFISVAFSPDDVATHFTMGAYLANKDVDDSENPASVKGNEKFNAQSTDLSGAKATEDAPLTDCDIKAADNFYIDHKRYDVPFDKIDGDAAITACQHALQRFPDSARLEFTLGRAYIKGGWMTAGKPVSVGSCALTKLASKTNRLENSPGSGSAVTLENGVFQVSYDTITGIEEAMVGDPIKVCLVSVPQNCPPDDVRGKFYGTMNLRTKAIWVLPDSSHSCGGA